MLLIKDTTFRPSSSQFSGIHYFGGYWLSYVLTIMLLFPRNAVSKTVRCIFALFWFGRGWGWRCHDVSVTLQSTIFQARNRDQTKIINRWFILNQFYEIYVFLPGLIPENKYKFWIIAAPWESTRQHFFCNLCRV